MYENFLSMYSDKSPAIPQQLYKPASRGLSAIAELFVELRHTTLFLIQLRWLPILTASLTNFVNISGVRFL